MKRFIFKFLLTFLFLFFTGLFLFLTVLFFKPEWVINKSSVEFILSETEVFRDWSWNDAEIDIIWEKWNERRIKGKIEDFCFDYDANNFLVNSCLEKVTWDLNLAWDPKAGFQITPIAPVYLRSALTELKLLKAEETRSSGPPEIWTNWQRLWSDLIPPLDFKFEKIRLIGKDGIKEFDLSLLKEKERMVIEALGGKLIAEPEKVEVYAPRVYEIPFRFKIKKPFLLKNVKLTALMNANGIPLKLEGDIDGVDLNAKSYIDLPLKDEFASVQFRKDILLKTSAVAVIKDLKKFIHTYVPEPYDELPAPLNTMNGAVEIRVTTDKAGKNDVLIKAATHLDLKGKTQTLDLTVDSTVPLNLLHFSRGILNIGIDFSKVVLQLPRLSRKQAPPQFFPDNRFKTRPEPQSQTADKSTPSPISFNLEAENEQALHIRSNLIEEPLRLNFNLNVRGGEIKSGYVKILPLKTTVFKRPIEVKEFFVKFNAPQSPVVNAVILFPLPEYKITMKVEGPVSDPKYAFTSKPPLPQNDIYSVLLFGRPLEELSPDDKNSARQTNQILAQGILSLSVLYFLAGSPVDYIGYDPESRRATAQIGLGRRSSLRVGAGQGGGVTGVRRSLGKGWYLDTSVQNTTGPTDKRTRDYGVLLERIIAY
ncbi:MAG: translocation/assembly module TamB domain-containing protein [Bacteriovoracia bacterium]